MPDSLSLKGRVILITGAAGYLGSAMTRGVLAAGGEVIAVGRERASLDDLRQSLTAGLRGSCHPFPADIAEDGAVAGLVAAVERDFAALHGLVNNAYAGRVGPVDAIEAEDFAQACAINLAAPFLLVRGFGDLLRRGAAEAEGGASVVNIGSMYAKVSPDPSVYGTTGANNPAHYGATKAGLLQLTRYLACNFAPGLVRVNSLSPGPFPNPAGRLPPGFADALRARVPMGRVGVADELAGPLVFLLSAAASYVNGADLPVDGGWTAW
jgi:NAD(P)-dependent dehydrogenase (short-subunit alcohol dehydrogenase family)